MKRVETPSGGSARSAAPPDCSMPAKTRFCRRFISSGIVRFAGWWSIFAGALALNSVCPICGSSACPVGLGTTGIIAGLIAALKLWGGKLVRAIVRKTRPPETGTSISPEKNESPGHCAHHHC
ncbi:MAG: hypothetical protein JXA07_14910 [Spirochaetes bacterium]|nr:hypothetical protein [Spirochaetota bacterium]